jgi:hypothetical protein
VSGFTPIASEALPGRLADWLAEAPGIVRVAVDGPACADPDGLTAALLDPLRSRGRPVAQVRASSFWRDASLRFERGREDVDSYLTWLDADALRREVLDAVVTSGAYLPSLRDAVTNRSTRDAPLAVAPNLILFVSGSLLLRHGLPFDRTIHLAMSPAARARRTSPEQMWTLPAHEAYDAEVCPSECADVVIKLDDPRHPAISWT